MTLKRLATAATLAALIGCADNTRCYDKAEMNRIDAAISRNYGGQVVQARSELKELDHPTGKISYRQLTTSIAHSGGESGGIFTKNCYDVEILGYWVTENEHYVRVQPMDQGQESIARSALKTNGVKGALEQVCEK